MAKKKGKEDKEDKERELYNAFVDALLAKLQDGCATSKELEIVLSFLKNNNIQAPSSNKEPSLTVQTINLPFGDSDKLL